MALGGAKKSLGGRERNTSASPQFEDKDPKFPVYVTKVGKQKNEESTCGAVTNRGGESKNSRPTLKEGKNKGGRKKMNGKKIK